jgi:hypothetical protein
MLIQITSKFNNLWWKFIPGKKIKVRWPVDESSADPNYHYRPLLEELVGDQGWDWDWRLEDNDLNENTLTIKFRRGKIEDALYFYMLWG